MSVIFSEDCVIVMCIKCFVDILCKVRWFIEFVIVIKYCVNVVNEVCV